MRSTTNYLCLDVGTKRIGVAQADDAIKIARPLTTIDVDEHCFDTIVRIAQDERCDVIIVGYPRNSSGEPTAQTASVVDFVDRLSPIFAGSIVFQDESLTSVMAEERLASRSQGFSRGDVDAEAACIILTDYLESHHG
ncbi:MAG: Holliday junction resolvase RuvX [Candidatus Saccharimonadales bacterium]|jgi:putative Holliday junction resolvase